MENVAHALQIAGFVLIFVLALSISINAFGEARQTAQIILDNTDREYDYTYVEQQTDATTGNLITQRIVRAETIIPSIYKAYKENYKIVFKFKTDNPLAQDGLYRKKISQTETVPIYYIDLEKEVLGSNKRKEYFIEGIIHGSDQLKLKYSSDVIQKWINSNIVLNNYSMYDIIKGRNFVEKLGVYYQEELQPDINTPDANKTKKRVITYEEQ